MAYAHEPLGQHVEEESAHELWGFERHGALLAAMGIIFPAEGDVFSVECDQTMVGDGDAVCVSAEIAQDMFRSAEERLSVDDPEKLDFRQIEVEYCGLAGLAG